MEVLKGRLSTFMFEFKEPRRWASQRGVKKQILIMFRIVVDTAEPEFLNFMIESKLKKNNRKYFKLLLEVQMGTNCDEKNSAQKSRDRFKKSGSATLLILTHTQTKCRWNFTRFIFNFTRFIFYFTHANLKVDN